ncbi:protein-L-isoaspartate(D-aspartate) O-methyltransferase [Campylobacter sp. RM12327]|uniref:protein-L-isoaspartate(D-aspartate) O-methyltransferase n=1 Tax=Campylobacter sputorum TaxID=206 RepID=UPI000B787C55|nr:MULTISPECIES: protein-L-isoaspartate(D-aspartate) O-methyltransferase [Campylobacter]ASM39568.1 L-isoaspartate protein carboxylmethyltransferase, type II [Campylobacter sputorum]MBE7358821.1 protein-L-isoaspartate(D-aspartate) O-methyltransferase [Campylobacter sp. RM11302]MBF6669793.1 protein-L-isoaspartate(D-aspartate) O-methyltransferase [Campylobacter sp. RM12327]MBF6674995.1 protein-L-isoaspartate(D-aspartate) O-methyltransferase [Campylobacter sp. RM13538]MBF6676571.1 protein-L-isoasp
MNSLEYTKCLKMANEIADLTTLSPKVYKAFCQTPREIFVPIKAHAYELNPHPISGNQWISSPLTVAKMTMALECEDIDNVLEIGCGSGYQAAILGKLAHRVFSIERIQKLADGAKLRFKELNVLNINIRYDDGIDGWKTYSPYERIIFSCACEEISPKIFAQLKDGGILVAPMKENGKQFIYKFKKDFYGNISKEKLEECLFVPLLSGRE